MDSVIKFVLIILIWNKILIFSVKQLSNFLGPTKEKLIRDKTGFFQSVDTLVTGFLGFNLISDE